MTPLSPAKKMIVSKPKETGEFKLLAQAVSVVSIQSTALIAIKRFIITPIFQ